MSVSIDLGLGQYGLNSPNLTSTLTHLDLAKQAAPLPGEKSLLQKNAGRFYTPEEIALTLIKQAARVLKSEKRNKKIKIIDPFCGDGRLVSWLLPEIKELDNIYELHIWDYDSDAVTSARSQIEKRVKDLNLRAKVFALKVDSFKELLNGWENNFDLVITNPPWEVIKPDPYDTALLSNPVTKEKYVASLKDFSKRLLGDFPASHPEKSYGGWGVNLARVGTELSVRLAKEKGVVAIVTPSTIFADQNSFQLRRWLLSENNLRHLNIYPAELKLFTSVDQPSVSFVLERNEQQRTLNISNYSKLSAPTELQIDDLNALLSSTDHIIPVSTVTSSMHLKILSSFSELPKLNDLEKTIGLWMGRELDETNYKSWVSFTGKTRFIKGRDIIRFNFTGDKSVYINESVLRSRVPTSINFQKIVWRDVSRPNQRRRVIATIVPPGYVAGNSLGVLYLKNDDHKVLSALLGLISSVVFEFQLRAYLATAHISAGVMRRVRIPEWNDDFIDNLSELTQKRLHGDEDSESQLEIQIAKAYGLGRDEFAELLRAFPKLSEQEVDTLLDSKHWKI